MSPAVLASVLVIMPLMLDQGCWHAHWGQTQNTQSHLFPPVKSGGSKSSHVPRTIARWGQGTRPQSFPFGLLALMGLCSNQISPPSSHLLKDSVSAAGDLWDKRCCSQADLDTKECFRCHCLSALAVKQTQPPRSGWTLPNIYRSASG